MKIVFTAGVFDLLHEGHINLLKKMREEAGANGSVIAMIHDDKSTWNNKKVVPVQSLKRRIRCIEVTGLTDVLQPVVSEIPPFEEFIQNYSEDNELVFMRGDDWSDFPGRYILEFSKVEIKFIRYTKGVSSTSLRAGMVG